MIKVNAEKLAEEVIPMLQKMFGEGIDFCMPMNQH